MRWFLNKCKGMERFSLKFLIFLIWKTELQKKIKLKICYPDFQKNRPEKIYKRIYT